MSVLLLLTSYAFAGGPLAVVLPTDTMPDEKELRQHVEETLERKDLKWEESDVLERPKPIATALLEHPTECFVTLNDNQRGELKGLLDKADELFVVLPTTDKPRGAMVWKWSKKDKRLDKIETKAKPLAPSAAPGKVVLLTKQGERAAATGPDAAKAFLGVEAYETVETDGALIDTLVGSKDCTPELEEAAVTRMAEMADGLEGDLVLLVADGDKAKAWRWDAKASELRMFATE